MIGKRNQAFTLIEILVTLILFATISIVASQSLFSLLRGSAKTERIKEIRQNGNYAMSVMETKIRNGRINTDDQPCTALPNPYQGTSLIIDNRDDTNTNTTFSCVPEGSINRIRMVIGVDTNYLTNNLVAIPTCNFSDFYFKCTQAEAGNQVVDIYFKLQDAVTSGSSKEGATQTFSTQVKLRNN